MIDITIKALELARTLTSELDCSSFNEEMAVADVIQSTARLITLLKNKQN